MCVHHLFIQLSKRWILSAEGSLEFRRLAMCLLQFGALLGSGSLQGRGIQTCRRKSKLSGTSLRLSTCVCVRARHEHKIVKHADLCQNQSHSQSWPALPNPRWAAGPLLPIASLPILRRTKRQHSCDPYFPPWPLPYLAWSPELVLCLPHNFNVQVLGFSIEV